MYIDTARLVGATNFDLPFFQPDHSAAPYIIKSIEGLLPPPIDVGITQNLNQSGIYQSSKPQGREIVVTLRMNPNYVGLQTFSDLRSSLYSLITPGLAQKTSQFELWASGSKVLYTPCYVSKIDGTLFTKDPEIQITLECLGPYLISATNVNPSLAGLSKSAPVITNPGNAPSGFHMEITFTATAGSFILTSADDSSQFLKINAYSFQIGDILVIDTNFGSRNLYRLRSGTPLVLLGNLDNNNTWLQLMGGTNRFTTSTSSFNWTSFYFTPNYWGI